MRLQKLSALALFSTVFIFHFPSVTDGQGNGNILALRSCPTDEVFPIPHYSPPFYIKDRIYTLIEYFFDQPQDQSEAVAILMTIWYYNSVHSMLALVDRMNRKQYAYAEYGDQCEEDAEEDEAKAIESQMKAEEKMLKPTFIAANDFFFKVESWWEIVGNTVDNIWNENQKAASRTCDFRRRGLMCMNSTEEGEMRCGCGKDANGVRMTATKGGICAIEVNQPCNFTTASRLMSKVYEMEVYNSIAMTENQSVSQTCFGDSFCTLTDLADENSTMCKCFPLITSETRAKRNVLLNYTVTGARCDQLLDGTIIKWGKWYVALTIIWVAIPLVLILAPHWDDICMRVVPGYYKHFMKGNRDGGLPEDLPMETYDVKMTPEMKLFIEENALFLDVDDPEYFDKVDGVDERELDPLERFILVPQCTDKSYHFEWPAVDKLKVWF